MSLAMPSQYSTIKADIEFHGDHHTELRGWLCRPEGVKTPAPAIVMTHGWSCLKEFYLDKYAELFAQHGFFVLVYDQRNFGESEGEPRQEIDPWQQIRDYRDAITFLQTQGSVDPRRIGIWGTSYSGGHVLVVSAIDKRVKCVVSQVPTISGWKGALRRTPPGEWAALRERFHQDRMQRFLGKAPQIASVLPDSTQESPASHASEDARAFFTGQSAAPEERWRFEKWRNEITLRSVELYAEYEPGQYITRIAPTHDSS